MSKMSLTGTVSDDEMDSPGIDFKKMQATKGIHRNLHVAGMRNDERKRRHDDKEKLIENSLDEMISEDEMDNPAIDLNQKKSSTKIKKKRRRQSFSFQTKYTWVQEYRACPEGTNMRVWLDTKNKAVGAKVSYTSFRRWVMMHGLSRTEAPTKYLLFEPTCPRPKIDENPSKTGSNETISEDETDIPVVDMNQKLSSTPTKKKKTRQSFSMETKLTWVREYQTCPEGTNMRLWLEKKNTAVGARVSYTSFRRWVESLCFMTHEGAEHYFRNQSKHNRIHPNEEMEKVLVKFIRIRNRRLCASGKQPCSSEYIRAKAKEFYKEMYGSSNEFHCSNSWLHRFLENYKDFLDLERSEDQQQQIPVNQATAKEPDSVLVQSSDTRIIDESHMAAYLQMEKLLTENKVRLLEQLMIAHSNICHDSNLA